MVSSRAVSSDTLFEGSVSLLQPASGYRVNVDSLLLAHFAARGRAPRLTLDLGAGVGAICLGLTRFAGATRFVLVEREPALLELGARNLSEAGAEVDLHRLELGAEPLPASLKQRADLVVCNPPFYEAPRHRPARETFVRGARFGELEPFLEAAALALSGSKARAVFAYPAGELTSLLERATRAGLVAKRLRLVHSSTEAAARLALVELRRARPGGLVVETPLFEWSAPGQKSPELSLITAGRADDRTGSPRRRAR